MKLREALFVRVCQNLILTFKPILIRRIRKPFTSQKMDNSSLNWKAEKETSAVESISRRLGQLEYLLGNTSKESGASPLQHNAALVERISQLETLLVSSELECRHSNEENEHLKLNQNQMEFYYQEQLKTKDCEISSLQHTTELLQNELRKANLKCENVTNYINMLPSEEELTEAKNTISEVNKVNHIMKEREGRMKQRILELQTELIAKEKCHQTALTKLEDLKPLEEAQHLVKTHISSGDLDSESMQQYITAQKAKLLQTSKIIQTLRQRLSKCDGEKCIGDSKIAELNMEKASLQQEILYSNHQIEQLNENLKLKENEKNGLDATCITLKNRIEQQVRQTEIQQEQFSNFIKLVSEINLCVKEISTLVEIGMKLEKGDGEELPLDYLISADLSESSEDDSFKSFTSGGINLSETHDGTGNSFSEVDFEWILQSLAKISDLRKNVSSVKSRLLDLYVEALNGKLDGCNVQ